MLRKFKQIWFWYWGDGSSAHPSIPPYTVKKANISARFN